MSEPSNSVGREDFKVLLESEAKRIILDYEIPTTDNLEASDVEGAIAAAEHIGYPVVLKALSSEVVHKSDVGGVFLDLLDPDDVRQAFEKIMGKVKPIDPNAHIIVQEMVGPGAEVIIGTITDPHFGPVLMVGIGGIFTELLEDVKFGLIPVDREHAWRMLQSLKGFPLLRGFREQEMLDLDSLINIMLGVSRLVDENPHIVELDLNPVIVQEHSAIAVDARIVIRNNSPLEDPS
jgi:acetyl-CoA synthetase (ADP-forming)